MTGPAHRVVQVLGPSAGGIRRHVATLAEHLPACGWEARVAGPEGVMDGLAVTADAIPVSMEPRRFVAAARRLRRLVEEEGADVVHAHGLTAGWVAVAAHTGRPVVLTAHNVVLAETAGRATAFRRALEGRLPRAVAATIAVSPPLAADLEARSGRPVQVIVPASPPPRVVRTREEIRAVLGLVDDQQLAVAVGRLHAQKALGDLLEATARLRDRHPGLRVAVVGEGPERPALEAQVARLGLGDVVALVGAQPDGPSWMAAADVVVMCSTWEGSPLVVAEALQLGRPLVATAVGDVPLVVRDGETGRLVPPSDPARLAAALGEVLDHPDEAERLAGAGRALAAECYSPLALVGAVAAVYEGLTRTDAS